MVLRGAQFQRFGPAGCACLTRRALSLYSAMFMQEQSAPVDLPEKGRMTRGHLSGLHSGDQYWQPHNKDSRLLARAGDLCHGHIGESSSDCLLWS